MRLKLIPLEGRTCGECTLCCKVMGVKDEGFEKPKDRWCQHAKKGRGCAIYETRPPICQTFKCLWLGSGDDMRADLRPDKIHGLLTNTTDGKNIVIHEDPGYPGHARQALRVATDNWLRLSPEHYVIVVCGTKRTFLGKMEKFEALKAAGVEEVMSK